MKWASQKQKSETGHFSTSISFKLRTGPNAVVRLCSRPMILTMQADKAEPPEKYEADVQPSPAMTLSKSRPRIEIPGLAAGMEHQLTNEWSFVC